MAFRARSIKALIRNRGNRRTEGQTESVQHRYPPGMRPDHCHNTISNGTSSTSAISWSQSYKRSRSNRSLDKITGDTSFLYRYVWQHLVIAVFKMGVCDVGKYCVQRFNMCASCIHFQCDWHNKTHSYMPIYIIAIPTCMFLFILQ